MEMAMKLKFAVLGLAALGGAALASGQVLAAMPNGIPQADRIASGPAADVDQVRWVCNPWGRCFWRPNYYGAYGYYGGPRRLFRPPPPGRGGRRPPRRWGSVGGREGPTSFLH